MNDEEFIARRAHLASQNVMTADNSPADDVAGLEEYYIEQKTAELMEGLYQDPERMQEYVLESHYENTNMLTVFGLFGDMMELPTTKNVIDFLSASGTFFEEAVKKETTDYVENL